MKRSTVFFSAATLGLSAGGAILWAQLISSQDTINQDEIPTIRPPLQQQSPYSASVEYHGQPSLETPQLSSALPASSLVAARNSVSESAQGGNAAKLAQMEHRFPDLGRELGMTSDEAEGLFDLIVRQQNERGLAVFSRDPRIVDPASGIVDVVELQRKRAEVERAQARELEALLGPGRIGQWKEYQATLDARLRARGIRSKLLSSSPLTEDQAARLRDTMISEHITIDSELDHLERRRSEGTAGYIEVEERRLEIRAESDRRILAAARAYLAADQLAVVEDVMQIELGSSRASLEARRKRLESP